MCQAMCQVLYMCQFTKFSQQICKVCSSELLDKYCLLLLIECAMAVLEVVLG